LLTILRANNLKAVIPPDAGSRGGWTEERRGLRRLSAKIEALAMKISNQRKAGHDTTKLQEQLHDLEVEEHTLRSTMIGAEVPDAS